MTAAGYQPRLRCFNAGGAVLRLAGRAHKRLKRLSQSAPATFAAAACFCMAADTSGTIGSANSASQLFTAKATIESAHRPAFRRDPREHGTNASGRKPAIRAHDGRAHPLACRAGGRTIAGAGLVVGSGEGGARRSRADATGLVS